MTSRQPHALPGGAPSVRVPLRVSAVCMALSGLLVAVATLPHPNILTNSLSESVKETPLWAPLHVFLLIAIVLAFVGACGIVAAHGNRLGRWGQGALAASLIGTIGGTAIMALEAIAFPVLAAQAPELLTLDGAMLTSPTTVGLGVLLFGWPVGLTILGVAAAQARVFPRGAGILLAVSAPAFIALEGPFLPVLGVLSAFVLAAAQLWWGRLLWQSFSKKVTSPLSSGHDDGVSRTSAEAPGRAFRPKLPRRR